jgi:hypothetical protein
VPNRANWVHDLNLDPRYRSAAGFGTTMIQKGQEDYMGCRLDQVGDVLEANHRIRLAHYARYAGVRMHLRHVKAKRDVSPGGLILMQAPVAARLVSRGITVHYQVKQSPMSPAMGSVAMRRYLRPGGKIAKRLGLTGPLDVGQVVTRANEGEITATPPKLPSGTRPDPRRSGRCGGIRRAAAAAGAARSDRKPAVRSSPLTGWSG